MPPVEVIRLPEPVDYLEMLDTQKARRDAVEAGTAPDTVFLLEHRPVITLGRNAHEEHVLLSREALSERGIALVETDRGGDVTCHCPGQMVAYPILNLRHWRCSVNWYLRTLEETVIGTLARFGLKGERVPGFTGVWVDGAKVAAIGVGLHRWVTFHGTALNVNPDMSIFETVIPCGISDRPVSSMATRMEKAPSISRVMDEFQQAFERIFIRDS